MKTTRIQEERERKIFLSDTERAIKPGRISEMAITTCQICGREIESKSGVIAHHGYRRPGQGWQTASCMGARCLPYEISRDVIPKAISYVDMFIEKQKKWIEEVKQGKVSVPGLLKNTLIEPTDKLYSIRQKEYLNGLSYEIKTAKREVQRLTKRYDEWKPNNQITGGIAGKDPMAKTECESITPSIPQADVNPITKEYMKKELIAVGKASVEPFVFDESLEWTAKDVLEYTLGKLSLQKQTILEKDEINLILIVLKKWDENKDNYSKLMPGIITKLLDIQKRLGK